MYDHIIRGGTVVDGTGLEPVEADVAIVNGVIVEVGPRLDGPAREATDASGSIVTPGFVDIHTHYDGQATWDELLEPSSAHGVTTIMMGNCGVGFAPVRPDHRAWLMELMEGVEEIPQVAMAAGMSWAWKSFGDYLDVLADRKFSMDVGVQLAHGPLRLHALGDRALDHSPATSDDIEVMALLAKDAIEAGAFGFTTSRTVGHQTHAGVPVPGTFAALDELLAIAQAVADGGGGVIEVAPAGISPNDDAGRTANEIAAFGTIAEATGLPVAFLCLQSANAPDAWRSMMTAAAAERAAGRQLVPLVAGRPFGILMGWEARNPFAHRPTFRSIAHLRGAELVAELRRPPVRAAILSERDLDDMSTLETKFHRSLTDTLGLAYVLGDPPEYEPESSRRLDSLASATKRTVHEVAYDTMLGGEDTSATSGGLLLRTYFNYVDGDHGVLHEQLQDPDALLGASDGGAHYGTICDASIPTYMISHWAFGRERGPRLALSEVIWRLTGQPAALYRLADRGRIAPGLRADLNVIDPERLRLHVPEAVHDLPGGARRLLQSASGYRMTMVAGEVTRRNGTDTGARPGRLVRS